MLLPPPGLPSPAAALAAAKEQAGGLAQQLADLAADKSSVDDAQAALAGQLAGLQEELAALRAEKEADAGEYETRLQVGGLGRWWCRGGGLPGACTAGTQLLPPSGHGPS